MLDLTNNVYTNERNLIDCLLAKQNEDYERAYGESQRYFQYIKKISLPFDIELCEIRFKDGRTACRKRMNGKLTLYSRSTFISILDLALWILGWNKLNYRVRPHKQTEADDNLIKMWRDYIKAYIDKRCKHNEDVVVYTPMNKDMHTTIETKVFFYKPGARFELKSNRSLASLHLYMDPVANPSCLYWWFESSDLDGFYCGEYVRILIEDPYFNHIVKSFLRVPLLLAHTLHLLPKVKDVYHYMEKVDNISDLLTSLFIMRPDWISDDKNVWKDIEKQTKIEQIYPR